MAATGILRVTPEELEKAASDFMETGTTINTITGEMLTLVTGLSNEIWGGEAASAYINKFMGLQDDIQRMYSMIQEHVEDLTAIAQNYSSAESESMGEIESLLSDVIE